MKVCLKCNLEKEDLYFSKDKNKKGGLQSHCKECFKKYKSQYNKEFRDKNNQYSKDYRQNNKTSVYQYNNQRSKVKRKTNINFKLRVDLSSSINRALRSFGSSKKGSSIANYLPYSIGELKSHLEKYFEPWMSWTNHGSYKKSTWSDNDPSTWTWQIDHVIPQSKLPYTSMEDENFKKCWALDNLRPLSSFLNLKKSNG